MDFSKDSLEDLSVFSIDSLDISKDALDDTFSFSEDSLPIFNISPDVSFDMTKDSLDQSFSHDSLIVINGSRRKKKLAFDLPEFFQPSYTSEKVATFASPITAVEKSSFIPSSSFTGTFGVFATNNHVMVSKIDAGSVCTTVSISFIVLGISPHYVAAFALEYNINSMILSSRIFIPFQIEEIESQVTKTSLKPPCGSNSTKNNIVQFYPKVFTTNSTGVLQRIDVDTRLLISTSINPRVTLDIHEVQITDENEVLETCLVSCTNNRRAKKKNVFRRFARWFRKKSSALKCF